MIEILNQEPTVTAIEFVIESAELIIAGGAIVLAVCGIAYAVQIFTERPKIDLE